MTEGLNDSILRSGTLSLHGKSSGARGLYVRVANWFIDWLTANKRPAGAVPPRRRHRGRPAEAQRCPHCERAKLAPVKKRQDKVERAAELITRRIGLDGGPSSNDAPLHSSIMNGLMSRPGQRPKVDDVERAPAPGAPPVPNAQWNEIENRWERWDRAADAWVPVTLE